MDEQKGKFQMSGLKFLYEMELIDDPQLINNLKLNAFAVSSHVRDIELLSSYHHKSMLIWVDLSWFGRKFLEKRITSEIKDRVQQLLPKFKFRVTTDRKILDLSIEKVRIALKGVHNENAPAKLNGISDSESDPRPGNKSGEGGDELQKESDLLQDNATESEDGS
jgi:hypothetical protein